MVGSQPSVSHVLGIAAAIEERAAAAAAHRAEAQGLIPRMGVVFYGQGLGWASECEWFVPNTWISDCASAPDASTRL